MATGLTTIIPQKGVCVAAWPALVSGESGFSASIVRWSDKTVSVTGNFDGGTVVIEASNDAANWFVCTDFMDVAASFTVAGMKTLAQNALHIRPSASGGGGSMSVAVIITGKD